MYIIGEHEGFNIFEPAPGIISDSQKKLENSINRNEVFLKNYSVKPATMRITGSFICAHAPDYVGVPTLDWTKKQWQELFVDMRSCGIDTVVWQASIWQELNECYYRSAYFQEYRQWSVVETMLEAAKTEGMQVFLGGYGSVIGWVNVSDVAIDREIERQFICMEELMQYRDLFAGIYFSPETAFLGERNQNREQLLNRLYREYFSHLKQLAPEKLILMSPSSKFFVEKQVEFVSCWLNMLDGVPLDILAPQDSIGCAGCTLDNQHAMWKLWGEIADSLKIHLWANVELFERQKFGGTVPFNAATTERVEAQIANVAPWVEKCICWEYPYFAGTAKGGQEIKQRIFHQ